jgi:hypothetical protein
MASYQTVHGDGRRQYPEGLLGKRATVREDRARRRPRAGWNPDVESRSVRSEPGDEVAEGKKGQFTGGCFSRGFIDLKGYGPTCKSGQRVSTDPNRQSEPVGAVVRIVRSLVGHG